MQNVAQGTTSDSQKHDKPSVHDITSSTTPQSSNSSPTKSETETFSELQPRFMTDSSESEEDSISEPEFFRAAIEQAALEEDHHLETSKFLLTPDDPERSVDPETQARLEALLEAAGIGKLSSSDGKHLADHEVLRRLTSSVSCALDEAAAALTRMRSDNPRSQNEKRSLVDACTDGDVGTVRKLLTEGRSVHETTEEGESLLSLASQAGYYELAQVLLAMNANVEDRGIKGDCTPLMEAASAGHVDIVSLLIAHGADVNAQSTSGNTPLMYTCAGGHEEVVKVLLEAGANVEDHNENGHTPLMEAASAGHVPVAKILLEHGAGINTHSNEFKESALTLACYKGHLEMVRFLLEAGADQEHKTDEMHTALMEASMDGHVEVARLLLDSGAQVNMPTDSFESPLTLAACGGHVDLALLLIERGASIEEVNDEGYTPLMEAAREGHEEMVALLLSQGANINAQTEETQETALTLACCGGFLEVADFLIKAGADIELGASTPLMEAAQEGHLDLVRYLLESGADVHAQTQTGDTALTYACENGHTDVADLLLQFGADLEHESEGGRTPLMKACRAGHLCTVQFLISKLASLNRNTTNNDHTPLSLACAGGHLAVVELLLAQSADPFHKLKDNSTMLIEAAKGGHTSVVQLLLDYPHSIMMNAQHNAATPAPMLQIQQQPSTQQPSPQVAQQSQQQQQQLTQQTSPQVAQQSQQQSLPQQQQPQIVLQPHQQNISHQQVPLSHQQPPTIQQQHHQQQQTAEQNQNQNLQPKHNSQKSLLRKNRSVTVMADASLTSAEAQQVRTQPAGETVTPSMDDTNILDKGSGSFTSLSEPNITLSPVSSPAASTAAPTAVDNRKSTRHEQILHKQQILEELQRVELQIKSTGHLYTSATGMDDRIDDKRSQKTVDSGDSTDSLLPAMTNIDLPAQSSDAPHGLVCGATSEISGGLSSYQDTNQALAYCQGFYLAKRISLERRLREAQQSTPLAPPAGADTFPKTTNFAVSPPLSLQRAVNVNAPTMTNIATLASSPVPGVVAPPSTTGVLPLPQPITASSDVSQNTAISDRPKAKPVSKKEGKNLRKPNIVAGKFLQQQSQTQQVQTQSQQVTLMAGLQQQYQEKQRQHQYQLQQVHDLQQLQQLNQQLQMQLDQVQVQQQQQQLPQDAHQQQGGVGVSSSSEILMPSQLVAHLHPSQTHHEHLHDQQIVQQNIPEPMESELARLHRDSACPFFAAAQKAKALAADGKVLKLEDGMPIPLDDVVEIIESITFDDVPNAGSEDQDEFELKKFEVCDKDQEQQFQQEMQSNDQHQSLRPASQQETNGSVRRTVERLARERGLDVFKKGSKRGLRSSTVPIRDDEVYGEPELDPTAIDQFVLGWNAQAAATARTKLAAKASAETSSSSSSSSIRSTSATSNLVQVATQTQGLVSTASTATVTNFAGPDKKQVYTSNACAKEKKPRCPLLSQQQQQQKQQPNVGTVISGHVQQPQSQVQQQQPQIQQNYQLDSTPSTVVGGQYSTPTVVPTGVPAAIGTATGAYAATATSANQVPMAPFSCMDVDSETDSNHDTALTLACAGGHEELVEFLLSRGADIEHRDKKGFTPLILAATAGHQKVVEILLNHGADIEAQSERTKDTPLSLACSGGRFEVVELLLNRGANKEHRNVSDYTPLSLAASGGYVNIIKLLLTHGAEINSRTGSKLGISPLMLAAMNGHTAAVKLLLDLGSDINAQIETNRNTALTLACFQGRHEVVSLLLDRKANVEHRAKTGLTPLMEAASGGYIDVGRVLLTKGADVNATPVPSSRDTALTIAADKGHCRFVELLLSRGTQVEVKNKKGNSPLWLAANGGHLSVVELLFNAGADIDSQDNRKVSCLMAAFRKGHIKVVKWMVGHVTQFPSDQEMTRYIATVNDKELLEKCQECVRLIRAAKETQAAKANKNATILLEELDMEKTREESKKAAAARRRERKKKKKLEKKEEKRKLHEENRKNETIYEDKEDTGKKSEDEDGDRADDSENEGGADSCERMDNVPSPSPVNRSPDDPDREEGDSGIDANSQGSCSSSDVKARERKKDKKKKKNIPNTNDKDTSPHRAQSSVFAPALNLTQSTISSNKLQTPIVDKRSSTASHSSGISGPSSSTASSVSNHRQPIASTSFSSNTSSSTERKLKGQLVFESSRHPADREDFEATGNENYVPGKGKKTNNNQYDNDGVNSCIKSMNSTSPKQGGKREEGWKEVVRKGQSDDSSRFMNSPFRSKKVSVPPNAISRVIGRGGSNINAIRGATGAHIEVEKQSKCQGERIITIKGSTDATKQAHTLIAALIKDPDVDILQMLPKNKLAVVTSSTWDKSVAPSSVASKPKLGPVNKPQTVVPGTTGSSHATKSGYNPSGISSVGQLMPLRSSTIKLTGAFSAPLSRVTAPRLVAAAAEKRAHAVATGQISSTNTRTTMSYTSAIMTAGRATKIITTSAAQTFAAKLSDITASNCTQTTIMQSNHSNHTNKQKSVQQTNSITIMSSTTQVTPLTSPQQTMTNPSPKHCRTLPNLSAPPPTMSAHYSGKTCYSHNSSSVPSSNIPSSGSNGQEQNIQSAHGGSIRVTPSPPIVSQSAALHQHQHSAQQQHPPTSHPHHHSQQQQPSQTQQQSSTQQQQTPTSTTTQTVPMIMDQTGGHQTSQQSNTPLEYSLFNDTFSKVTQQSVWGNRENESHQKGMNFATVAGGGVSANASNAGPSKFIDNIPPQVDASKAPGYRGAAMCSPVSSKANNSNNVTATATSTMGNVPGASPSGMHNPIQPPQFPSAINYNIGDQPLPNKSAGLAIARPGMNQQNIEMSNSAINQFNRAVFAGELAQRNVAVNHQQQQQQREMQQSQQQREMQQSQQQREMQQSQQQREMQQSQQQREMHQSQQQREMQQSQQVSQQQAQQQREMQQPQQQQKQSSQQPATLSQQTQQQSHHMASNSQPNIEVGLFKNNNGGFEHANVNANLLKMVPNDGQPSGVPLMSFHPHMQSFAPSMSQSASVNTTVSMSRLNPRAPDFSSSLHLNNKPQVTMFNAATGIHPNMFAAVPAPPTAMQSNNLAMLGNFPLGKYQAAGAAPGASRGPPTSHPTNIPLNGQTRWQFGPPHNNYPPHQDPMMAQIGFPNHLGNIGAAQAGNMDLMAGLENGGSPTMSPSSPAQVAQEMGQMKLEDRKVPRPIGTERAWKNYTTGMGPGGDADSINWMLNNEKLVGSWNLATGMDRHQMFRSNASYNRVSNIDAELHQMMESTFQTHLENPQAFPNGNAAGLSLMPGLTLMPGQFGNAPVLPEMPPPNETSKIEAPAWGMPDPSGQDKHHPGWNKWTH